MLHQTGIVTHDLTLSVFPDVAYLVKAKAVLECFEEIPCNPCATSCPFDAIYVGPHIHELPKLNLDKCTGCGLCVVACPGLAIYTVALKGNKAIFKLPYEMLETPKVNEVWHAVNREGLIVCDALITKATLSASFDHTYLLTIEVDASYLYDVITVRPYEQR